MRIAKAVICAGSVLFLISVFPLARAHLQSEQLIAGLPVKITNESYGMGTRFVYLAVQKRYYSKENLERIWRYYCEKYPDKKDKLDIRVYVDREAADSKSEKERSFEANFNRQGEGAAAGGGDNEFYSYQPDLDRPDQTENVQLKGRYPFLRDAYSGDSAFDFVLAAWKGDIAKLEQYLGAGGDVNVRNDKGRRTALMAACEADHIEIARMLLTKGANPNLKDREGFTALGEAASAHLPAGTPQSEYHRGDIGVVKLLLANGAIAKEESGGWPAFVIAAEFGNNEVIKLLLENGADINVKDVRGMSALSRAIYDRKIDTAKLLISKGADLESREGSDDTPLIYAASRGPEIVRALLDRGAKADASNRDLETPLMRAYDAASVLALLDHGADLEAKDKRGFTALMHAVMNFNAAKVTLLLEKGADINARTPDGDTPLSISNQNSGNRAITELLLQLGAHQ